MNKKTMAASVALCMLAMGLIPTSSADPCDTNLPNCEKKTAVGPYIFHYKPSGYYPIPEPICFAPGLPLPCVGGGLGGVSFDISGYNIGSGGAPALEVYIWAEFIGPLSQPDPSLEGFEMIICSDRDDDGVCTNQFGPDLVDSKYSDGSGNGKKDKKPDDFLAAAWDGCIPRDVPNIVNPNADWDDLHVIISAYADNSNINESEDSNDEISISFGSFDIYLDVRGYCW